MRTIYPTLLYGLLTLLAACDLINPEENVPGYLYVTPFTLNTNPATEGSNTHKITEVWLTVNGEFLGAYALPALIPVLGQGEQIITLDAGIRDNGVAATPEIYPFYESFVRTLTLRPNEVDTLRPVVRYRNATRFAFIEPFENINHIFREVRAGTDFNRIQLTTEGALEGSSALIQLNRDNPAVEIATVRGFRDLITRGFLVYLEVDYKSDAIVLFGVQGFKNGVPAAPVFDPGFLPSATWNKIYFNLSALVVAGDFDEHRIVLQTVLPNENGVFTQNNANVWLDNVKLVHF
ncbi:MAG TPA: hypothetical protein PKC76_06960 [Saprospiraceae bacterium]|nr:hypothetical protein [Saprospiraceae bacterium]HMP23852.1 hypothetical protein [Saprospiraceae bacterium]